VAKVSLDIGTRSCPAENSASNKWFLENLDLISNKNYRTYNGPDKDKKALQDIVVKQSLAGNRFQPIMGLSHEAMALEAFKSSGSPHIVKMYRHLYRERGHNSMKLDVGIVHRIFLEYCPGGDLAHWLRKKFIL
jgi:hypothetical protein